MLANIGLMVIRLRRIAIFPVKLDQLPKGKALRVIEAELAELKAFVATAAEFTPPIIYSKDSRDKLVFRVDARPEASAAALQVGQPLDVRLAGSGS